MEGDVLSIIARVKNLINYLSTKIMHQIGAKLVAFFIAFLILSDGESFA